MKVQHPSHQQRPLDISSSKKAETASGSGTSQATEGHFKRWNVRQVEPTPRKTAQQDENGSWGVFEISASLFEHALHGTAKPTHVPAAMPAEPTFAGRTVAVAPTFPPPNETTEQRKAPRDHKAILERLNFQYKTNVMPSLNAAVKALQYTTIPPQRIRPPMTQMEREAARPYNKADSPEIFPSTLPVAFTDVDTMPPLAPKHIKTTDELKETISYFKDKGFVHNSLGMNDNHDIVLLEGLSPEKREDAIADLTQELENHLQGRTIARDTAISLLNEGKLLYDKDRDQFRLSIFSEYSADMISNLLDQPEGQPLQHVEPTVDLSVTTSYMNPSPFTAPEAVEKSAPQSPQPSQVPQGTPEEPVQRQTTQQISQPEPQHMNMRIPRSQTPLQHTSLVPLLVTTDGASPRNPQKIATTEAFLEQLETLAMYGEESDAIGLNRDNELTLLDAIKDPMERFDAQEALAHELERHMVGRNLSRYVAEDLLQKDKLIYNDDTDTFSFPITGTLTLGDVTRLFQNS